MSETDERPNNNKRKRKKSFLKNARKYAKQGHYGCGSKVDPDTYQYFVNCLEKFREGFETDEIKLDFINKVFEQTEGEEIKCCCNQIGCRLIQTFLPFANDSVFERFMKAISENLRPLCSDKFASHVLEALVEQSVKKSMQKDLDDEQKDKYKEYALKISKFLMNNMEDYIWDIYGNHIMRKVLISFAQLPKLDENIHKQKVVKEEETTEEIPQEYLDIVQEYGERLIAWPQFKEFPYSETTSGFLQVLLRALKKVNKKLLKTYLKKLLEDCFSPNSEDEKIDDKDKLPDVFMSKSAMMVLETSLKLAKSKMFTQIFAKCFAGRLVKLSTTRATNFSIQKLLIYVQEKVEFETMFEELDEHFQKILDAGHTGILLSLAQTCKRLSTKQGAYVQNIMKILNCLDSEEQQNYLVLCLSRFVTYEECKKMNNENIHKDKLNLHGTLILQTMLDFNKPIKIVNSMLNMDTNDLKNLLSNSMGSHIVDSYVTSQFVGEKSREKLVRKMQGTYQYLISSKFGSRSFEAIWNAANLKFRMFIMNELSQKDGAWVHSEFGKIISTKINYPLYKRSKEDWKTSLDKPAKSKNLLDFMES